MSTFAYALSATVTIATVWFAVWLLMTGWVKLQNAIGRSEWLEDNGLRLVRVDRDGLCSRGWHHTGCGCVFEDGAA